MWHVLFCISNLSTNVGSIFSYRNISSQDCDSNQCVLWVIKFITMSRGLLDSALYNNSGCTSWLLQKHVFCDPCKRKAKRVLRRCGRGSMVMENWLENRLELRTDAEGNRDHRRQCNLNEVVFIGVKNRYTLLIVFCVSILSKRILYVTFVRDFQR